MPDKPAPLNTESGKPLINNPTSSPLVGPTLVLIDTLAVPATKVSPPVPWLSFPPADIPKAGRVDSNVISSIVLSVKVA